jgi:uncharacterized protein YraI
MNFHMDKGPRFHLVFLAGFGIGSFVGVALALLAFALAQDTQPATTEARQVVESTTDLLATEQLAITATPEPRVRTKTALDVKLGPGESYAIVGTISRGEAVDVVGRDADANWVSIRFPPGSLGRGWVPVENLDGLSDATAFAVVLPTPLPRTISVPTFVPFSGDDRFPAARVSTPTPRATSSPVPTTAAPVGPPTPRVGPTDVSPVSATLLSDGRVSVVVTNRGPGELIGRTLQVTVRDLALRGETVSVGSSLAVGATASGQTQTFRVITDTEVQVIVDPNSSLLDPDRSNNMLSITLRPARPAPPGTGGGE